MDRSNKYVNEFFDLTCYPDILDILNPISGRKKEITESMAVIKYLRRLALKNLKKQYVLFDFCAGNALTSTTASFLFKNFHSFAIDKAVRDREWKLINRFKYLQGNINDDWISMINHQKTIFKSDIIIIGVHSCRELAKRIIEIYNKSEADHLILMPCCTGGQYKFSLPQVIKEKVGDYLTWCVYLLNLVEGKKRLIVDESILSPKNALIIANRGAK